MRDFNRGSRSGGRGFSAKGGPASSWERRGFNDRGSRGPAPYRSGTGPVEMHRTICDKCHKDCEVPFRPTSGKPIYCKDCFESNRGSDSRYEGRSSDRQMFEAVCDECGNSCKVPFQPSSGKPVYCSNCFGDKKESGDRNKGTSQLQYQEQFEQLNNKLDRILSMLTPLEKTVEKIKGRQSEEKAVKTRKKKVVGLGSGENI